MTDVVVVLQLLASIDDTGRSARILSLLNKKCFEALDKVAIQVRSHHIDGLISTQSDCVDFIWRCIDLYKDKRIVTYSLSQRQAERVEEEYWQMCDRIHSNLVFRLVEEVIGCFQTAWQGGEHALSYQDFKHYLMSRGRKTYHEYLTIQRLPWHVARWKLMKFTNLRVDQDDNEWFEKLESVYEVGFVPPFFVGETEDIPKQSEFPLDYLRDVQNNAEYEPDYILTEFYSQLHEPDGYVRDDSTDDEEDTDEENIELQREFSRRDRGINFWNWRPCLLYTLFGKGNGWEFSHPAYHVDEARRSIASSRKRWRAQMHLDSTIPVQIIQNQVAKIGQPCFSWQLRKLYTYSIKRIVAAAETIQRHYRNWSRRKTAFVYLDMQGKRTQIDEKVRTTPRTSTLDRSVICSRDVGE